jgi:hypothetical protein
MIQEANRQANDSEANVSTRVKYDLYGVMSALFQSPPLQPFLGDARMFSKGHLGFCNVDLFLAALPQTIDPQTTQSPERTEKEIRMSCRVEELTTRTYRSSSAATSLPE